MPDKPKTKVSRRTLVIGAAIAGIAVLAYIYWKRKQGSAQPQAFYSTDTSNQPGMQFIPAQGGGATELGTGVVAPPPNTCGAGYQLDANGNCVPISGNPPPPGGGPPPPPTTYKHGCFDGAGPGCGGPNRHCEYWTVTDGSGQPNPPSDCVPKGGGGGGGQAPTKQSSPQTDAAVAQGTAQPATEPVVNSERQSAAAAVTAQPGLLLPSPVISDAIRLDTPRLLSGAQAAGRDNNESNLLAAMNAGPYALAYQPGASAGAASPPAIPPIKQPPPPHYSPPPNTYPESTPPPKPINTYGG